MQHRLNLRLRRLEEYVFLLYRKFSGNVENLCRVDHTIIFLHEYGPSSWPRPVRPSRPKKAMSIGCCGRWSNQSLTSARLLRSRSNGAGLPISLLGPLSGLLSGIPVYLVALDETVVVRSTGHRSTLSGPDLWPIVSGSAPDCPPGETSVTSYNLIMGPW